MPSLHIATYNIHKGFSQFNQHLVLHPVRERLRELDADIVFLQEVQGEHRLHGLRHHDYPTQPQHEFIAEANWPHTIYGRNSVYAEGHHGNAIISRFPIARAANNDISAHRFERRGLLHAEIAYSTDCTVHCLCVHFGLFASGRRTQTEALIAYVRAAIPAAAPLIIAGDFNDWRNHLGVQLAAGLDVYDAFQLQHGRLARSFPASLPVLRLDRVYVRGFTVRHSRVHSGGAWRRISDHAALSAHLTLL